ncbi:MAG: glycoside hydrolase family 99-like domain-containing protein [Muribaculaceae bacterium]|nr:glycoside hydrolase family 99-like domain-containing protein [Muribaculaceae bacterium]
MQNPKLKARIIAFYLPQYYPTELNNQWYGMGFTEWTNVGKAQKLFRNHYQPHVPADLGYYDLRNPETRKLQAQLAKEAGIEGFCYYHYWFGEGHEELDIPFKEVVKSGEPDFPFCLCWANQSWYSKFWNNDINCAPKLIAEQKYDNEEWRTKHFLSLLSAFQDKRYIKIDNKLLFMIYRPLEYPDVKIFMDHWKELAAQYHLPGFYFVGQATNEKDAELILKLGFDGVNISRKDDFLSTYKYANFFNKYRCKLIRLFGGAPYHYQYKDIVDSFINISGIENNHNVFPTLIHNWDHSPRSGKRAVIFHNAHPEFFRKNIRQALKVIEQKDLEHKIVFLKSWNEWGEGNYIEPDLKYGRGYINVLKEEIKG